MTVTYLDAQASPLARARDLLAQMTLAEKVGLLFHPAHELTSGGGLVLQPDDFNGLHPTRELVVDRNINHLHLRNGTAPLSIARWHNQLQELAETTRLGIPVTVSTDPRHGYFSNPATGLVIDSSSRWPEHTGIGAINDQAFAERYGDVVRRELRAMGIRTYLGPMADLFTDPRWGRGFGTFGEDVDIVTSMTVGFIRGLRGGARLGPESVSAIVKHFPGGGPQLGGHDAHDPRYREQVYPGSQQALHLRPFEAAIQDGVTQVMPYYGMPIGTDWDEVGFAFNAPVISDLLRGQLGFTGVVCSDWNVIGQTRLLGFKFGPNGWGLEDKTPRERLRLALDAGVDQFGGDDCVDLAISLVEQGEVTEDRIDESAGRILVEKFTMGLFEDRYVDVDRVEEIVGARDFSASGREAQARSMVLLKASDVVPIRPDARVFADGLNLGAAHRGQLVGSPDEADIAVLRLHAPFDDDDLEDTWFHDGRLTFTDSVLDRVRAISDATPTIVVVYLERPAILTDIVDSAAVLIGDFGATDDVIAEALFEATAFEGRLPFDLPSSWQAVVDSREDVPFDTSEPLFEHGFGLNHCPTPKG